MCSRVGEFDMGAEMDENYQIFGSAFLVDATWYARCEGDGGILLPIDGDKQVTSSLVHGQVYSFHGRRIKDHNGCSRRLSVVLVGNIAPPGGGASLVE